MTDKLPPNLLALFAPRPALRYMPPIDQAPEARHSPVVGGVAQFLHALKEPSEYSPTESWLERRDRLKLEKREKQQKLMTEDFAKCSFVHAFFAVKRLTRCFCSRPCERPSDPRR